MAHPTIYANFVAEQVLAKRRDRDGWQVLDSVFDHKPVMTVADVIAYVRAEGAWNTLLVVARDKPRAACAEPHPVVIEFTPGQPRWEAKA